MEKKLKYFDLMEDLRKQIVEGEIRPGDKLPSENELSATYHVSRQTVRKALQILQGEGYVYAEHGRGTFCSELTLHKKKSRNIAVVTTYLSDYIFPRIIAGIDHVLTDHGYSIILKNTRNSRSLEAKCLEELLKKDIDGLIIEPSKSHIFCKNKHLFETLDYYQIPYVFIQGCYAQMEEKPWVFVDDETGMYQLVKHMLSCGHRDIVGIFKADDMQGQRRHKGYVKALNEFQVPYDPDKVIWFYTEDRKTHPYEQMKKMIAKRKECPFTAVAVYNDQIAVEVLRSIDEMGLSCPEDISVTGYDDSYLATSCKVPLTTVRHPQEKLGETAAELLLRMMKDPEEAKENIHIMMEPQIQIRQSVKKLLY